MTTAHKNILIPLVNRYATMFGEQYRALIYLELINVQNGEHFLDTRKNRRY